MPFLCNVFAITSIEIFVVLEDRDGDRSESDWRVSHPCLSISAQREKPDACPVLKTWI